MDSSSFTLRWDDDPRVPSGGIISEEVISSMDNVQSNPYVGMENHSSHLNNEVMTADTDQIAAENLIFLAQDIVGSMAYGESSHQYHSDNFTVDNVDIEHAGEVECQITEEVITDDWVQPGGQERVEVSLDQMATTTIEQQNEGNDIDVPLPTDQDEYTAMRPYPCDFCSRRFRKKSNLMNHMVAHQNDRPFGCNLCGARYVRRFDLLNHLKVHAYVPDDGDEEATLFEEVPKNRKRKRSTQSSNTEKSTYLDKTAVAARTQQYEGSGGGGNAFVATLQSQYEATDPSRPFVCQHCGVGFAREKALASHARIHGGDSPLECSICGELCWSKENLISHTHSKHPHTAPQALPAFDAELSSGESYVEDERESESWIELICKDCGAGFQRADLLQRHVRAAHNYMYTKKEVENCDTSKESDTVTPSGDGWSNIDHACSVCGEGFRDALELLAHAGSHARSRNNRCMHCGQKFADDVSVAEHVTSAHPQLPPSTCLLCGRACHDQKALSKHMVTHESSSNMLFCSKCGKSFHNKGRLKRHMVSHRDKAVVCNVCGVSFADGRSLMNHRHSHTGTGGKQFPCQECGKTFGSRSSQQIHIRIHTGERPYGCRFCWKAFADGGTLRKHERIHTGEKPYACAVCPRAFNQRVVLREHVRSHHSGPDTRRGTGTAPYWCPVCDRLMAASTELVQHIIEHCDNNTAMKRLPQRRRKAQGNDQSTNDLLNKNDSENSASEAEQVEAAPVKKRVFRKAKQVNKPISPNESTNDLLTLNVSPNCSAESSVGGSARTKGKLKSKRVVEAPARPKMIHTQRAKPSDTENNNTRRKGRSGGTLVTTSSTTTEERVRPRTKNVSYHDGVGRLPTATFPSSIKREPEGDIAADLRAIQDIDQGSSDDLPHISSEIEILKCEPEEDDNNESSLTVKLEMDDAHSNNQDGSFCCEMCSETFCVREQLLAHVRVHI
ncbi:uncharacterized protein LOC143913402 isoform X2 [Arctopsyche grandis]|uniref:uncharacterized protein LOC143913402 isoform X2 n=1 Tax=Arctopsyche grandis TaxID=121162 RepID=UPI00406D643A